MCWYYDRCLNGSTIVYNTNLFSNIQINNEITNDAVWLHQ